MEKFTGVKVIENFNQIDQLYKTGKLPVSILDSRYNWYPNSFLVLKQGGKQSALAKISSDGEWINPIKKEKGFFDIRPKNKEQIFLFEMLSDENIIVITVTGKAGTGKSIAIGSYLVDKIINSKVDKVIISKPMEIVSNTRYWGTLPGDSDDKFEPFLLNFKYLFEKISGKRGVAYFEIFRKKKKIEFMPIELMRGLNFENVIVYLDECQNMDAHMIKTLGTRMGENSRLIMSGDYNQIDVKSKEFQPGLVKVIESDLYKSSSITSHIHLLKVERGPVAELFSSIFGDE